MFCRILVWIFVGVFGYSLTSSKQNHKYTVRHDRAEVTYFNEKYLKTVFFNSTKYNRTSTTFNIAVATKIDFIHDIKIQLKISKLVGTARYRFSGISFGINLCDCIKQNLFGVKAMLKESNVTECPFKPDYYVVYNAVPDESKFPPNLPFGQYKLEGVFTYNGTIKLAVGNWYGAVVELVKWRK